MAIQTSGAISLSTLQGELGGGSPISISEYYKNGPYMPPISYSNWYTPLTGVYSSSVPTSGAVSLSSFRGVDTSKQWDYNASPVKSGYSSSSSTTFNIHSYLPNLSSGVPFAVCTSHNPATGWKHGENPTLACTYGTPASLTMPQFWDKQWVLQISYNGASTVTIGGYYAYKSTNNPYGEAYLRAVARR